MAALPPLFAEEHACEPCGLAYAELSVDRCVELVTDSVATLVALLTTANESSLRRRPEPGVWSVVEYACHVRDVLWVFALRMHRGVHEDRPSLDPMYNDWRAERFGYARLPVDVLLAELGEAVEGFVAEVRSVPDDAWSRTVVRRPDEVRTVRWLVRQAAHECVHHLADVRRILESR
jgi:hypothetical protein